MTNENDEGGVDLTVAEVYTERGQNVARGAWHVVPGPGAPLVYFVPDDTKTARLAIVTLDMLLDNTRFERTR